MNSTAELLCTTFCIMALGFRKLKVYVVFQQQAASMLCVVFFVGVLIHYLLNQTSDDCK